MVHLVNALYVSSNFLFLKPVLLVLGPQFNYICLVICHLLVRCFYAKQPCYFRFRPSFLNFCIRPSVSRNLYPYPFRLSTQGVSWRHINLNLHTFTITVLLKSGVGCEVWVSTPLPVPAYILCNTLQNCV